MQTAWIRFFNEIAHAMDSIETLEEFYKRNFEQHPEIALRAPSEFAEQLNVHVNSLNRAVKSTMSKTTSEVIAERLVQESKVLLRHTDWSISDIAFALGFREVTHFSNFFKKHMQLPPSGFRSGAVV